MQFVFGDYVLEPDRRELSRGPKPVALGPQVFNLLLYPCSTASASSARTSCWTRCGTDG